MLGLPLNLMSCQQAKVHEKTKKHNTLLYFLSYMYLLTGVNSHKWSDGLISAVENTETFILPFKPAGETKLWLVRLSRLCNSLAFFRERWKAARAALFCPLG